jgi:hypothetical protein
MIYLGPQKKIELKTVIDGRILYADSYQELLTAIYKIDMPAKYIRKEPVWHYYLSVGRSWQLIKLRDNGFIEIKELTAMQERKFIINNQKRTTKD